MNLCKRLVAHFNSTNPKPEKYYLDERPMLAKLKLLQVDADKELKHQEKQEAKIRFAEITKVWKQFS